VNEFWRVKENPIGTRIRKLRVSKDLTQDNMAIDLGITAGAYAKIERGETDPSASRLLKIAEILEVDIAVFFTDNTPAPQLQQPAQPPYGYASKNELEQLTQLVKQLSKEMEKLKGQMGGVKKVGGKGKK
jgi:transcriptional regulator with XRE-family HTH domain